MPNPSPTPLSPNPPYSALLGPTRPYSALLGPTRPEPAPRGPTACPTPPQPHSALPRPTRALLGPTRPYSAPFGPNRPPRGGLAWGHLRVQLLPVQSDTAGLSASVFLPVLGSAALAAAIKYYIYIYIYTRFCTYVPIHIYKDVAMSVCIYVYIPSMYMFAQLTYHLTSLSSRDGKRAAAG